MAEISFGGLATGMDTTALIEGLMAVEKRPLNLLEAEKTLQNQKKAAFLELDGYLQAFKDEIRNLNESNDIRGTSVSLSNSSYFSATGTGGSLGNYQVQVAKLAQVQKTVSANGYSNIDTAYFGSGTIDIDGHSITIDGDNNSLAGIRDAINASTDTHGVTATIIDDGSGSDNFRMVLTGKDASTTFNFTSNLVDGVGNPISFDDNLVQNAQQAEIYVDSIKVVSDTNTISGAIDGVTLNLLQVSPLQDQADPTSWTPVNMSVSTNADETISRFGSFVKAYNDVMSFINKQSKTEDNPEGGVLLGDAGMNNIKRKLQRLLTSSGAAGGLNGLSSLGFATQKDGTLKMDESDLRDHLANNLEAVELLMVGDDGSSGVMGDFEDYMGQVTSIVDGFYKSRSTGIKSSIESIDNQIEMMQMRLDKREETLQKKFNNLELLVSGMNSQSSFLTQQMDMLSKMMTGGK